MLTCFKPTYLSDKTINDYSRHSTNQYIKRITDRYYLERNKPQIKNPFDYEDEYKPRINMYSIFAFLSISTLAFFLYKRLK
jgi:hypothetical protein